MTCFYNTNAHHHHWWYRISQEQWLSSFFYHVRGYWKGVVDGQRVETRGLEFIALHHQMEMVAKRQSERTKQVCK
jgi:hypothetical protein